MTLTQEGKLSRTYAGEMERATGLEPVSASLEGSNNRHYTKPAQKWSGHQPFSQHPRGAPPTR